MRTLIGTAAALALIAAMASALPPGAPDIAADAASFETILDVEDPNFELLSGDWVLTKPVGRFRSFRYEIAGPGTGAGQARWVAEGLPPGTGRIEFWVNSGDYPSDARWQVVDTTGAHDLVVDMRWQTTGWHTLGDFQVGRVCVVNVSDLWTTGGGSLPLDAIRITSLAATPPPPDAGVPPHIGICIDDVGNVDPTSASTPIYTMLRLPFPMTFAVMPQRTHTTQSANEIHSHGSEVILHQPMTPISGSDPGAGGITDAMTPAQVRSTVSANLDALPHCVGMNNHMGSLITQQSDKMTVCLEEVLARGMFFYDSRTITTSVAYDVAQNMGCFTAERDLFIDGSSQAESMGFIRELAMRALEAPEIPHLAIGHVRDGTAAALAAMAPELEAMGVEVWPISRCLAQTIEADRVPAGCAFSTEGPWTEDPADALSKLLRDDHALRAEANGTHRAVFTPAIPWDGQYDVYAIWRSDTSGAPDLAAVMTHRWGISEIAVDQSAVSDTWVHLGRFDLLAGGDASLTLTDAEASSEGTFTADAIRFVHREPLADLATGVTLW